MAKTLVITTSGAARVIVVVVVAGCGSNFNVLVCFNFYFT
jgi:hypothetical protein